MHDHQSGLRWNDRGLHVHALRRGGASHALLMICRIDRSRFNAWRHKVYAIKKVARLYHDHHEVKFQETKHGGAGRFIKEPFFCLVAVMLAGRVSLSGFCYVGLLIVISKGDRLRSGEPGTATTDKLKQRECRRS